MPPPEPGFALYIHWPFCQSKCPYCDFNSHVRERIDAARWQLAYLADLDRIAAETPGRTVASVFFGGGTPSLMPPDTAGAILERIRALWPQAADIEITLEANPGASDAARFRAFRDAGVNRLSIGVQALDDAALRFLGRRHSAAEALAAVEAAASIFSRTSFDLIYARPGHTVAAWRAELGEALRHAGEHLSVYQLTIEPGTAFHTAHARGDFVLPDEDTAADLYEITRDQLGAAGLPAYEISNHARPGAESRHNLVYWRYGDYAGIGPGAHGRLTIGDAKFAMRQHRAPEVWLERIERDGHAETDRSVLAHDERGREMLLMGLRLAEGVARARFAREAGTAIEDFVDARAAARLAEAGLIEWSPQALRATESGRQRLNAVLAALVDK
ncbi:MAG: coproporphyrinogen III oxidase [Rhodospirillaceae bacterium]|nr:coproporphyrinogen III oxidase [Rhodospirillaceae bacterium]